MNTEPSLDAIEVPQELVDETQKICDAAAKQIKDAIGVLTSTAMKPGLGHIAVIHLVPAATDACKEVERIWDDDKQRDVIMLVAGFLPLLPATFVNPLHIAGRDVDPPDECSGDKFRRELALSVPYKITGQIAGKKKRGAPSLNDELNWVLDRFVRSVFLHASVERSKIYARIFESSKGRHSAWADEFVAYIKGKYPAMIESKDGVFRPLAEMQLKAKRASQAKSSSRARSIDGDNLWPQFRSVVLKRLPAILAE